MPFFVLHMNRVQSPLTEVVVADLAPAAEDVFENDDLFKQQRDAALDRVDDLQEEVDRLEADRIEMLDRLGMTEHEWEWRNLNYTSPFRKKIVNVETVTDTIADAGIAHDEIPDLPVDEEIIPDLPEEPGGIIWTEEQKSALAQIDAWLLRTGKAFVPDADDNFLSLVGYAGTGKTTLLKDVASRYAVTLTAMTGKAAYRMQEATGFSATTLHRVLYWPPEAGQDLRFERLREPPSSIVVIDECFDYKQPVLTEHGWEWIGRIVSQRKNVKVWSRNPSTGCLELKPILRWLKRETDKPLIVVDVGRTDSKRNARKIKCTPDHKVLTPNGYVRAGDLKVGDDVVVHGMSLTREQMSVCVGSILGDGSLNRDGVRTSVQMKFMLGEDQLDYLKAKHELFGSLASELRATPSGYENGKPVWAFNIQVSDDLVRLAREMPFTGKFPSGRRQWTPTDKFLDYIDEQALAVWYLDNGSRVTRDTRGGFSAYAALHTERFDLDTNRRFVELFQRRFNIAASILENRGLFFIRFSKKGTDTLFEVVRKFTPKCMSWKVCVDTNYVYTRPERQPDTTVAPVRSVSLMKPRYENNVPPVYDLEVADFHNYVAGNIVVSNCSMMTPTVKKHLRVWTSQGVRVLLVGDGFQLPPVISAEEAKKIGSEDYSVFSEVKGPVLTSVMRSVGGVLRAATKVRDTGELCNKSDLDGPKSGYEYRRVGNPLEVAVDEYLADRDDHLLVTWTNKNRMTSNSVIRTRLGHEGPLPDPGEPVLIRKNGQGRMNGEIVSAGTFETGPMLGSMKTLWMTLDFGEKLLVSVEGGDRQKGGEWMDGQMPWVEDWKKYQIDLRTKAVPEPTAISWGYCVTAHAAQGSQMRRTTVFLERGELRSQYFRKETTLPSGDKASFGSRFLYTATTRSINYTLVITS